MTDRTISAPPRLPQVGEYVRGHGVLVAVEEIPPPPQPPPQKDYIFEALSARVELRWRGKLLRRLESYSDHFGLETSVASAIKQARSVCEAEGITAQSEIECVAVKTTTYFRARPGDRENCYAREFLDFRSLDRGWNWNVPPEVETVAWSSRNPDGDGDPTGGAAR